MDQALYSPRFIHKSILTETKGVHLTCDNKYFICHHYDKLVVYDISTNTIFKEISADEKEITAFTLHPQSPNKLVYATSEQVIVYFDFDTNSEIKSWRAHEKPILDLDFHKSGTLLATASADGTIQVYDMTEFYVTHLFNGQSGMIHKIQFHPNPIHLLLLSLSSDNSCIIWSLKKKQSIATLHDHISLPTDLCISDDILVTCGRDKSVYVYSTKNWTKIKHIPLFSPLEGIVAIDQKSNFSNNTPIQLDSSKTTHFISITQDGKIISFDINGTVSLCRGILTDPRTGYQATFVDNRIIKSSNLPIFQDTTSLEAKIKYSFRDSEIGCTEIHWSGGKLFLTTTEQNILTINPEDLSISSTVVGFNDQIISAKHYQSDLSLLVTNSGELRFFNRTTGSLSLMYCHKEPILSCAVTPNGEYIATGSKDSTIRLWRLHNARYILLTTLSGHAESVIGLEFASENCGGSTNNLPLYLVSASTDKSVGVFDLRLLGQGLKSKKTPELLYATPIATQFVIPHSKPINNLRLSPQGGFIVTCSFDKTCHLSQIIPEATGFSIKSLQTLTGHKKAVYDAAFSPINKVIATCSADQTVRIWDFNGDCLKTLQGATSGVLKIDFIGEFSTQIVSGEVNGTLRIWDIQDSEQIFALDNHSHQIWTLSRLNYIPGESPDIFLSGDSNSTLIIWKDITKIVKKKKQSEEAKKTIQDQQLNDSLRTGDINSSFKLGLDLERIFHCYKTLEVFISPPIMEDSDDDISDAEEAEDSDGESNLKDQENQVDRKQVIFDSLLPIISTLNDKQIATCIKFIAQWVSNMKTALVGQYLLATLFTKFSPLYLVKIPGIEKYLDALIAYSERYETRITKLYRKSFLLKQLDSTTKLSTKMDHF